MVPRILIVEDDESLRGLLLEDLPRAGFEAVGCGTLREARELLGNQAFHALLLDCRLPDGLGADLYRALGDARAVPPAVFMTNFPDVSQAVELIKAGASDYVIKPFSMEDLAARLRRAILTEELGAEVRYHRRKLAAGDRACAWVGLSAASASVVRAIEEVAAAPLTPVLVSGETGVGKEIVARKIHLQTRGESQPFVEVDCATIPRQLFESELFGHERGAFTSADRRKEGILELGREGTVFLDEIGEIDVDLQGRLLRVLETRRFRRVGGVQTLAFGARIVAATNRNIDEMVAKGAFRADLYYRLAAYQIRIPPLRNRREDVPPIAEHFLCELAARHGKRFEGFGPSMQALFERHAFPGNARELRNLVEQAVIQSPGGLASLRTLPSLLPSAAEDAPDGNEAEGGTLSEQERRIVTAAMKEHGGNKSAAARKLGISRPALLRRLARMGRGGGGYS
jgi:DNA-binding NtrC family response regulator